MPDERYETFDQVKARLDEIVEAVNAEGTTLDEALSLYEEAVKLGLSACDLSEEGAEELLAAEAPQTASDAPVREGASEAEAVGSPESAAVAAHSDSDAQSASESDAR